MAEQQDGTHQAHPPALAEQHTPEQLRPGWPEGLPSTADAAVDAILARLEEVGGSQTADHDAIYASIHDELLAELNADPQGPARSPAAGA
jgi:hypothetical protein